MLKQLAIGATCLLMPNSVNTYASSPKAEPIEQLWNSRDYLDQAYFAGMNIHNYITSQLKPLPITRTNGKHTWQVKVYDYVFYDVPFDGELIPELDVKVVKYYDPFRKDWGTADDHTQYFAPNRLYFVDYVDNGFGFAPKGLTPESDYAKGTDERPVTRSKANDLLRTLASMLPED